MEERFYKIRLATGRVLGPVDLDRVRLFILKGHVIGVESARSYPSGEWRDINTFPEIAELLVLKLEGKLTAPERQMAEEPEIPDFLNEAGGPDDSPYDDPQSEPPPAPSGEKSKYTGIPGIDNAAEPANEFPLAPSGTKGTKGTQGTKATKGTKVTKHTRATKSIHVTKDTQARSGEKTVLMEPTELKAGTRTKLYDREDELEVVLKPQSNNWQVPSNLQVEDQNQYVNPAIAAEPTQMMDIGPRHSKGLFRLKTTAKGRKLLLIAGLIAATAAIFSPSSDDEKKAEAAFRIQLPTPGKINAGESEKTYQSGLKFYLQDTVEGYKKSARIFLTAANQDQNNVKALCLLASSYMNLFDVVNRDEKYFNTVTRLIEMARGKGLDLPELVMADAELYQILGNPDAAISRISEHVRSHDWDPVMHYYQAVNYSLKGQYPEAMRHLNAIEAKAYFSPKVDFLMGTIYEKNGQTDVAMKAFERVIARSPKHVSAHMHLADLLFNKDNLPEALKHVDFVIFNGGQASRSELARAHYVRARIESAGSQDREALNDLETALKINPGDPDTLLEYYTIKARVGSGVGQVAGKAKMFDYLARGERLMKEGLYDEALGAFIGAREAQPNDPTPLLKLAEAFRKKGELESAKLNLQKALRLNSKSVDIYPKLIQILIESYDFEEATRVLATFKELNASTAVVDRLQGDLYAKQEKPREALPYYKRAVSSSNADSSGYIAYATLMLKYGREDGLREAAFYYGLALRFDPFSVDATVGIGKAFAQMENIEKGVEYVTNALQTNPHKAALFNGIAEIYLSKSDYTSAIKFAQNAITTDPDYALAYKTKGAALAAQDKTRDALAAYRTYVNLAPLDPAGRIERYRIYLRKMQFSDAAAEIKRVIDSYPKYPGAYYMWGVVYKEAQDWESARKAAENEIQNNPTFVPAYVLAGTAFNVARDYNNALNMLQKALRIDGTNVEGLIQAAIANRMLKAYSASQSLLEKAEGLDPGNQRIQLQLGQTLVDMGDKERAITHLKRYLEINPDASDRAEVQRVINSL